MIAFSTFRRRMREMADRHPDLKLLLFAAVLNALLFGACLALFTVSYETDDDLNMQFIASGFYTGQPSEYLVFTNVVIGWMLRGFYGFWHGCNWYLLYLLAVHYCALTAFAFVIVGRRNCSSFVLLYAGFFLLVETRILLNLQFTTTAFVAGMAGLFLLVDGLRPARPTHWPKVIAGIVLVTLMGLIREMVAPLLVLIAWPFLIERFRIADWRRVLVLGLVCGGFYMVFREINASQYRHDPAWAEFSEYNRLIGQIRTSPLKTLVPRGASGVGWSANDAWMFDHWYYPAYEVFGPAARLRNLVNTLATLAPPGPFSGRFWAVCTHLPTLFGLDAGLLLRLALLNAACCLFFAGSQRARCFLSLAAMYAGFATLTFWLLQRAYLPERVAYNMPLFMHAVCLYWASGFGIGTPILDLRRRLSSGIQLSTMTGLLALAGVAGWAFLYFSALNAWSLNLWAASGSIHYLKSEVDPKIFGSLLARLPADKKPVLVPVSIFGSPLEQSLFFHPLADRIPFSLMPYTWLLHSPVFRQFMGQHQLTPASLVRRPDVLFAMGPEWLEPLQTFYREHYRLAVRFDSVLDTDSLPGYRACYLHLYRAHVIQSQAAAAHSATQAVQ